MSVAGANAILQVAYIGFQTLEVAVGNQTSFSIQLQESAASLDEVVVVGYGTQRKATVTGAVVAVKGRTIDVLSRDQCIQFTGR